MSDTNQGGQPDPQAATIVDSVLNHPGLQVNEAAGQPMPADDQHAQAFYQQHGGQPATSKRDEPAPEATPAAEPAAPTQPSGRLLAGKYRSVEELERATMEAQKALRDRETELRTVKAVNQHLEEVFAPLRQQRETPRPTPVPVTFDQQNQPVVDPEALQSYIRAEAARAAAEQVQETLRPLSALSHANSRLRAEYPEVAQRESEFAAWLSANPEMQQRVTQDPDFYLEGAYLKFERDRGISTTSQNAQTASAAQGVVQQARSNASPAGGSPVATRRPTENDAIQQRIAAARKLGEETGNWRPYKDLRTAQALGGAFLNALGDTTWGR